MYISVVAHANPWHDFLPALTALETAQSINGDLNFTCTSHKTNPSHPSTKVCAFASFPVSALSPPKSSPRSTAFRPCHTSKAYSWAHPAWGHGLDGPTLLLIPPAPFFTDTLIFLNSYQGLPDPHHRRLYQSQTSRVRACLALGCPLETTIVITRPYPAGVCDILPELKLLLSHSAGTLVFLRADLQLCGA